MKKIVILMTVGIVLIVGGLLGVDYWVLNAWFLLVPIGGFAIFISGAIKLVKKLEKWD